MGQQTILRGIAPHGPRTHSGGCHCRAIRFTVRAPSKLVAWDCNCSICLMKRNTHFIVPAADFSLAPGSAERLSTYTFGTHTAKHLFCATCGVVSFYRPRSNPDGVAVTVHCLDAGTVDGVEVKRFDGAQWEAAYAGSNIAACTASS